MLAKKYRFHRQNHVRRVYRSGSSARTTHLSLKFLKQKETSDSRLAVVVSKKVDKRATIRNRIRRRVYEVIRTNWNDLPDGYDLVITVHDRTLTDNKHRDLAAEVIELLKKAGLYTQVLS
jgi:ribonuclease P protein component